MKLFYDCPIQAAYMAKEFGVKFISENGEGCSFDPGQGWLKTIKDEEDEYDYGMKYYEKLYISPESEHIFEEKDGDMTIRETNYLWNGDLNEIIMRDNKHFFAPLRDNN